MKLKTNFNSLFTLNLVFKALYANKRAEKRARKEAKKAGKELHH